MHMNIYLICRNIEQPSGFDNFQSLVHHGSGINCYLGSHAPLRVIESLLYRNISHLFKASASERPARSSKEDPSDRSVNTAVRLSVSPAACASSVALKTLEYRAVFRVDREEPYAILSAEIRYESSACDKRLLVGKSNVSAAFDRLVCRCQTADAHQGIQDYIAVHLSYLNQTGISVIYSDIREFRLHSCSIFSISYRNSFRREFPDLFNKTVHPASAGQSHCFELIFIVSYYLKGLGPDRTRAAHYQYFSHVITLYSCIISD